MDGRISPSMECRNRALRIRLPGQQPIARRNGRWHAACPAHEPDCPVARSSSHCRSSQKGINSGAEIQVRTMGGGKVVKKLVGLSIVWLCVAVSNSAFAQVNAVLSGTVADSTGALIPA